MAEESTKKANTFKYYNNEYDLDALKLTMREGLNDYINTLSYYKYGNRGKEVRDAFDEMWEAMLTPGRMYFDDTKGVFWDRQNKISNKADAKDAAHDPYGLAAYYIESKLKGATPWEDPDEKARKEKEASMPTLQSGYQEALYEKLFGVKNPTDQAKQDWANLKDSKRYNSLIDALKDIDITLFKDYLDRYASLDEYNAAIEELGKYLTDESYRIGFLDDEYHRFNVFNPYVDWHVFGMPTSAELREQLLQLATAATTQPTTSTTDYWQLMLQLFEKDNYGDNLMYELGTSKIANYSENLTELYNNLLLRSGYPALDKSGNPKTLTDLEYALLNAYLYTALQNAIGSSALPSWLRKENYNTYWINPTYNGRYGPYVWKYDTNGNKLYRIYRPDVEYYVDEWGQAQKADRELSLNMNDILLPYFQRHGGRMIPKAYPGADTTSWDLWSIDNYLKQVQGRNYNNIFEDLEEKIKGKSDKEAEKIIEDTLGKYFDLTLLYGLRKGADNTYSYGDAYKLTKGSGNNKGAYGEDTNEKDTNGDKAKDILNQDLYKAFTGYLYDDKGNATRLGRLWAKKYDEALKNAGIDDDAMFYDNDGNLRSSWNFSFTNKRGKQVGNYKSFKDYVEGIRNDDILAVGHSDFVLKGERQYYLDDDGNKVYVVNSPLYRRTGKKDTSNENGYLWTDYEVALPNEDKVPEVEVKEEVKKEEEKKPEDKKSGTKPEGDTGGGDELKKKKIFDIEPWAIGILGLLPGLFTSIHANNRVAKTLNEHLRSTVYNPYELLRPVVGDFATRMHYNDQAAGLRYFSLTATTSDATLNYLQAMHGNKAANDLETLGYLADNKEIRRTADEAMKLQLQNTENRNRVANTNLLNINLTWEKRGEIEAERIKGNADSLNDFFNKSRDFAWNMYTYKRGKKDENEKAILAYGALSIVNKYDDMRALVRAAMKEALPGTTSLDWTNYPEFVEANRKISQAMNKELAQYSLKDPNDIDIEPFTELNITDIINNLKSAVKLSTTSSTTSSTTTGNKHGGRLVKKHFNI